MRLLNVEKNQIPVQMLVVIEGEQYEITFNYNASFDFFTVSLSKDNIDIVVGEKIIINKPLFTTINNPFEYTYIIPMDLSNLSDRISFNNWGDSIWLWVFEIRDGVVIG